MRSSLIVIACLAFVSCSVLDPFLGTTVTVADQATGELVSTTVGDSIADNADGLGTLISSALNGISPLAALLAGGAATALFGSARRKKQAAKVEQ